MDSKFHKEIPKELKQQAIRAVWSGEKKVKEVCRELGVSKQAYYEWEHALNARMEEALNPRQKGRKLKYWVRPEDAQEKARKAEEKLREQKKRMLVLEAKNVLLENQLRTAKLLVETLLAEESQIKKKDCTAPRRSRICSNLSED